ncbi:DegT/DnrJ/EryC1/StrS family aminotransferase [Haloferula sp. A504]|uniref:DegT/DnrJ/EryC1/StrS family aminotransferase n=1 Tax=Haloferula sp. A504 TaxID=3373601 RepID=UPI0031BD346F|nr:DegT/DnrJ/EryC1/StrS family aminotransferase [Verrucomicrobiaceae bacterium E54]
MIPVTQPSCAPLDEYRELLAEIWDRGILTNNGPVLQRFEAGVTRQLNLPDFVAVSNGTLAIQLAIRALDLRGDIVTTPFTWVATLSAIQWEGCRPVFCDVRPDTFNIDPEGLERAITPDTVAILPVHVFGNPCDVEAIEEVAGRHGLKVIYDAAHAVGSTYRGRSLLEYGDISATSLHATKILNTAEGGACVARDPELSARLRRLRSFGFDDGKEIVEEGCNGKLSELHAALGLANLRHLDDILIDRKRKYALYRELLDGVPGLVFQKLERGEPNYSYFPVLFGDAAACTDADQRLQNAGVIARRYFHPSVNTLEKIVPGAPRMSISEDLSSRILCLPLYRQLADDDIRRVASLLR